MKPASQSMIAKAVGVSQGTVSLALQGDPRIPAGTAARVRKAAARLGYRPDPALAAAAAARWHLTEGRPRVPLAYVSQYGQSTVGMDVDLWRGASQRAAELGYRMDRFCLDAYADSAALQRVLLARGIRGLVVGGFYESAPLLTLNWERLCAVSCGLGPFQPKLHAVDHDAYGELMLAWQRCRDYGYRRPGFAILLHPAEMQVADDQLRRAAMLLCLQAAAPEAVPPCFYVAQDYDALAPSLVGWYRQWRPDVVIGLNSMVCQILCDKGGVTIPGEAGFATLTRVEREPCYAGVKEQAEAIGGAAVDLLQMTVKTNQWGLPTRRIRHLLEPEWCDGASLPH